VHAQIVLFDGFDPLDVVGPFEVLVAGGLVSGGAVTVELVSAEGPRDVLSGSGGLVLRATATLDPEVADVVVVPGASGPLDDRDDLGLDTVPILLARTVETGLPTLVARALADPCVLVSAVCGGSLALAMAGLLDGRAAVTHHLGMDVLAETGAIPVAARVVDDGDLITAGGVTSGLDLALYILERQLGPQIAHAVERLFDYERRGTVWRRDGVVPVVTFAAGTSVAQIA